MEKNSNRSYLVAALREMSRIHDLRMDANEELIKLEEIRQLLLGECPEGVDQVDECIRLFLAQKKAMRQLEETITQALVPEEIKAMEIYSEE